METIVILLAFINIVVASYAQWVSVHVKNLSPNTLHIANAELDWGKFYADGNKDRELSSSAIDQVVIASDNAHDINSCGRLNSASGTEGQFHITDGKRNICTLYWNCPWGAHNSFEVRDVNSEYVVTAGPWNHYAGAIGNVDVEIRPKSF
jgi:hypothetical protein